MAVLKYKDPVTGTWLPVNGSVVAALGDSQEDATDLAAVVAELSAEVARLTDRVAKLESK